MTTTTRNKYPGSCDCGRYVGAGEGFYTFGRLTCQEPVEQGMYYGCQDWIDSERLARAKDGDRQRGLNDRTFVSEYPDVNAWLAGVWAKRDERDADPEYQAQQKAIAEKREREDRAWAKIGEKRCPRCGGAGRSDRWVATGSVCHKCYGHGSIPA